MPVRERHRGAKVAAAAIRGGLQGLIAGQESYRRQQDQQFQVEDRAAKLQEAQAEHARSEQMRGFLWTSAQKDIERAEAYRAEVTGENEFERKAADDVIDGARRRLDRLGEQLQFLDDKELQRAALEAGLEFESTIAIAKDLGRAELQVRSGMQHGFITPEQGEAMISVLRMGGGAKDVRDLYYKALNGAAKQASLEQKLQRGMQSSSAVLDAVPEDAKGIIGEHLQRYVLGGYQEEEFMDALARGVDDYKRNKEFQRRSNEQDYTRGTTYLPQNGAAHQTPVKQPDPISSLKEQIAAGQDPVQAAQALGIDPEALTEEQWAALEQE